MRPAPFAYERAESVDAMVEALATDAESTKLLAGGQSLLPLLGARSVRPRRILDIDGLTDLEYLIVDDTVRIGALCRHATVERSDRLTGPWSALREAARQVALHPIRQRGTLGGSLAHAHPGAELLLAAVTYDAVVTVRSRRGVRQLPAGELVVGPHRTALAPDEAIVEVTFPERAPGTVSAFTEVARHAVGWPLASVCAVLTLDGGVVVDLALGVGAAGPVPRRVPDAERLIVGEPLSDKAIAAVAAAASTTARPEDDPGEPASDLDADSRRDLVAALVRRTLERLRHEQGAA